MGDRQSYEDSRKGYPVTFDNLSEEYERYREDMVTALAAKDEEIRQLRVTAESVAHELIVATTSGRWGEDELPYWRGGYQPTIESIMHDHAATPRPTEGGDRD